MKTLCKHCDKCEEYTFQRTITRGKRKGELFKFKYCNGNKNIIGKSNWGPFRSNHNVYVASTKNSVSFASFLKKNKDNVVLYLGDSLDLRMKMLREVSKSCRSQAQAKGVSMFPGVSKVSYYKDHSDDASKKIWEARFKDDTLKEIGIGTYYTELEAAHAYYTYSESQGRDINRETVPYKTYQNWLKVKGLVDGLNKNILKFFENLDGDFEYKWVSQLLKVELEHKNKQKFNQRKYEWETV